MMRSILRAAGGLAVASALSGCFLVTALRPGAKAPFHPADPALQRAPLYFYPTRDTTRPPRAVVFFFGNDVGFWAAHQRLAELLSRDGYSVIGFDVKRELDDLPDGATREAVYLARVDSLLTHARAALGANDRPLVIAGHSIGGEIALWTAAHLRAPGLEPGLVGVVAMSPGQRGHLRTGLSDLRGEEPHERGSFAVDSEVGLLSPRIRVALVRGELDGFRYADSGLVAAGARLFLVPKQHHSLKGITAAAPVVRAALQYATRQDTVAAR
ncbi:MAG TPA: thioesterase domain-containing protein [Gemmatirosa sp.]